MGMAKQNAPKQRQQLITVVVKNDGLDKKQARACFDAASPLAALDLAV